MENRYGNHDHNMKRRLTAGSQPAGAAGAAGVLLTYGSSAGYGCGKSMKIRLDDGTRVPPV